MDILEDTARARKPEALTSVAARNREQAFRRIREQGGNPFVDRYVINIGSSKVHFHITKAVGGGVLSIVYRGFSGACL